MPTTTITMSTGTWYQVNDSTNHSSASWLRSSRQGFSTYPAGAILQFTIPSAYKYKKINRVVLGYYTKAYNNGSEIDTNRFEGMSIAPYIVSPTGMTTVTGATLETVGQKGEFITVEPYTFYGSGAYPRWRTADVTSLFTSNLYEDAYFTVILQGFPGTDATSNYGAIGGVGSGYAAYITIDYEDVVQLPPSPNYPVGSYVTENTDLLFSWSWNSSTKKTERTC